MVTLKLGANLKACPVLRVLSYKNPLTVISEMLVSPFSRNTSLYSVPSVGVIIVCLMDKPTMLTPTGTVNGVISSYTPGKTKIVSPDVAWPSACFNVPNGLF